MSASLDLAAPKLGSGARFKKLSTTLAARGASNPDALAAFIGRRKYGSGGMGKLSAGKSLANPDLGIYLSETTKDDQGKTLVCPECNYSGPANRFGASGASLQSAPGDLRTPAPGTGGVRKGVPLTVKGGAAHALANDDYSGVIDLDWAAWDAEHGGGGGGSASQKAHDTASATAKATAKRHMASKRAREDANKSVKGFKAKSASQLKPGHSVVWGNKGQLEEHTVVSSSRKPNGHVRVVLKGPDGKTHVTSMAPTAQVSARGTPGDKSLPQVLKKGGFAGQTKAGNPYGLSNTRSAVELASGTVRRPIHGPMDVLVARKDDGTAVLRHRHGGAEIASLRKTDGGKWVASVNGRDLEPRDHQRTALMEAVGTWNKAIAGAVRPQAAPLQPEPHQTPLMAEYGIPAVRSAAFATPTAGSSDGPRVTSASAGDDGTDENGLSPKGQAIYKKLLAKGFPAARALAFAKNSQKTKAGAFGKAAA